MFYTQGSEKIHEFVRQAASLHVVNAVYFIGLIVLAFYSYHLKADANSDLLVYWERLSYVTLGCAFLLKVLVNYTPDLRSEIKDEQFELLFAFFNIIATFSVVECIKVTGPDALFLLYSFLPIFLLILISPLTWNKRHDGFIGFYGFVEWFLLLFVFYWSSMSLYFLFENHAYVALASNGVVLFGPTYLKFVRRKHMDKLMVKMYQEIYIDPLTKLKNRKCFYEYYDKIRGLNRTKNFAFDGLGVFFVDVDHFKKYNDFYGHELGDECLCAVGNFLKEAISSFDGWNVYRYGGEEFLLVGPMHRYDWNDLASKEVFPSWIRGKLTLPLEHEASEFKKVTLSAGAQFFTLEEIYTSNAGSITKQVDALLYKAKETRATLIYEKV